MTTAPPAVDPAADWHFPSLSRSELSNSIPVLEYHCPDQYVVTASLVFRVPLDAEPAEIEGVAGLVARCLGRGAGGLSADEFSDALASCGAELDANASPDGFAVQLSVPMTHLDRGLELMALVVSAPSFDEHEVEQEKRLRLQEIEHAKAYPGAVTVELLNAALFGDTRAARPAGGSAETVLRVTRSDLSDFAQAYLHPGDATLVLAGDFSQISGADVAERALGGWDGSGEEPSQPGPVAVSAGPRLLLVDWPDATQATLRIAGPGVTRADPRWPALLVANYVVGGSFGSRLNTLLRERKGLTYGISSSLDSGRRAGIFGIGGSVRTDAVGESLVDVLQVLRDAAGGLADDEVQTAIRATTDSAPLGFERAASVAARVEMLLTHGLPLTHVDSNLARIRQVTAASANAVFAEVVDPGRLTVVVAAPAETAVDALAAVGHAPLDIRPRPVPSG